jgi:hypothetical protein
VYFEMLRVCLRYLNDEQDVGFEMRKKSATAEILLSELDLSVALVTLSRGIGESHG